MCRHADQLRVALLGSTGMLGSAIFHLFRLRARYCLLATAREFSGPFRQHQSSVHLCEGLDVREPRAVSRVLTDFRPDVVINCVGLIKQIADGNHMRAAVLVNSIFPNRLEEICAGLRARLVHISTDCVFSGDRGLYSEDDPADADDVYGISKLLGEVCTPPSLTIRTSLIGHEYRTKRGLLEWFLSQDRAVMGYKHAVFSGLPTNELARVIHDYVIPDSRLSGLYHIAAEPISKYDLLLLIREVYGLATPVLPDTEVKIDRSLDGRLFAAATGYCAPDWRTLIASLHSTRDFYRS